MSADKSIGRKARGGPGAVDFEMRSIVASRKYRDVLSLLLQLQKDGSLEQFLQDLLARWENIDFFGIALSGGLYDVGDEMADEFVHAWPSSHSSLRRFAEQAFGRLCGRICGTRLADGLVNEVMPDAWMRIDRMLESKFEMDEFMDRLILSSDLRRLDEMTAVARERELIQRMNTSRIVTEYRQLLRVWGGNREELIEGELCAFFTKAMLTFERHISAKAGEFRRAALVGRFASLVQRRSELIQQASDKLVSAFGVGLLLGLCASWCAPALLSSMGSAVHGDRSASALPDGEDGASLIWVSSVMVLSINGLTAFLFWYDKQQAAANRRLWRVSEDGLCITALMGGWPAGFFAMKSIRHKTSKLTFQEKYNTAACGNALLLGAWLGWALTAALLLILPSP
eukprot:TRINITY_DN17097_c0_g1_i2.p1 TRINITY_DN17097_c0_g1~~TRINITY_DN17097_c0_g1_i2.p1  ORF type:complete len:399 (-),score=75.55 TRINITY_DN17097_c0_g1_i2:250-1446(-)